MSLAYSERVNYTIRHARQDDLSEMYNISRTAHRLDDYRQLIPPASLAEFQRHYRWSKARRTRFVDKIAVLLADSASMVLVAEKGNSILGYVLTTSEMPGQITLKGLFIRPRYQGRGVGRALLVASYATAPAGATVILEVLEANRKAIRLYEQQGFVLNGHATTHYFGAKMVRMVKRLS